MTKLKNGAMLLDVNGDVVLAKWEGHFHPYVTWRLTEDGHTFLGHYFAKLDEAVKDFMTRTGNRTN